VRFLKMFLTILLMTIPLSGCQSDGNTVSGIPDCPEETGSIIMEEVIVGDRVFTVEEINAGIKDTFNCYFYLHELYDLYMIDRKNMIGKDIEYELFFIPTNYDGLAAELFPPKIGLTITSFQYPELSEDGRPQFYSFWINVTPKGLQSDFFYQGFGPQKSSEYYSESRWVYLGSHTMLIGEIYKPQFEVMDEEWVKKADNSIRLFLDFAPTYWKPGKYHITVKGFFESDTKSIIVIESENGVIHQGFIYSVHSITGEHMASIRITIIENPTEEAFQNWLKLIKLDAAVSMEITIDKH